MAELGSDFDIRPVTPAEAAAWREIRLESLKNHPTSFSSVYEDVAKFALEDFAARIPEPGGADVLLGVYVEDELCGCAGFVRERGVKSEHKGLMWGVYLRPTLRGRGVAEALMNRLLDHARGWVTQLQCSVTSENTVAANLYQRLGFVAYGVEPRALRVDGQYYDEDLLIINFD